MDKSEKAVIRRYLKASDKYYSETTGYVKRIPSYSDPVSLEYQQAARALHDLLGPEESKVYMRKPTMVEDEGRHVFVGRFTEDGWEEYLSRERYFGKDCYYSVD